MDIDRQDEGLENFYTKRCGCKQDCLSLFPEGNRITAPCCPGTVERGKGLNPDRTDPSSMVRYVMIIGCISI